jgi:hypothetical protein
MRGLDPRIHAESQQVKVLPESRQLLNFIMDCRVKPGNDSGRGRKNYFFSVSASFAFSA